VGTSYTCTCRVGLHLVWAKVKYYGTEKLTKKLSRCYIQQFRLNYFSYLVNDTQLTNDCDVFRFHTVVDGGKLLPLVSQADCSFYRLPLWLELTK